MFLSAPQRLGRPSLARRAATVVFGVLVGLGALLASAGTAAAHPPGPPPHPGPVHPHPPGPPGHGALICTGTFDTPGTINPGNYDSLTVRGACLAQNGVVNVRGSLTVAPNSVLGAQDATDQNGNCLTTVQVNVGGGIQVQQGAFLSIGDSIHYVEGQPAGTGCPNSNDTIRGGIDADNSLGAVVHGAIVDGGIAIHGGGGGTTCAPLPIGPPPYSDVEDTNVHGGLSIANLQTCWLGIINNQIDGMTSVNHNVLGDPDAIEIGLNHFHGNLACAQNQLAFPGPGGVPTNFFDGGGPFVNSVTGAETGQCAGL